MKSFDIFSIPLAGSHIIDASAGTGKTYTICGLVLRLLIEKELSADQILVVTFTEAATEDLRTRIREQLRAALDAFSHNSTTDPFLDKLLHNCRTSIAREKARRIIVDALRNFDEAPICTIHSFCQKMLREYSLESGTLFEAELITSEEKLKLEITRDYWRRTFYQGGGLFTDYAADKLSPADLMNLLNHTTKHSGLTIIPEAEAQLRQKIIKSEKRHNTAFTELCRTWPAARNTVREILFDSEALHRGRYSKTSIPSWLSAMDFLAALPSPTLSLFDKFIKFTDCELKAATKKGKEIPALPFFELCEELWQANRELRELYSRGIIALKQDFSAYALRELQRRKNIQNSISFDDLLGRLNSSLLQAGGNNLAADIARQFPAALIDEFQDTDPLQFGIFNAIYGGGQSKKEEDILFLMIGDPKQAIYSFRGADIYTYIQAIAGTADKRTHTLTKNWRSSPNLVKAVNTLFGSVRHPFIFEEIPFHTCQAENEDNALHINGTSHHPFHLWYFPGPSEKETPAPKKPALLTKDIARPSILSSVAAEIVRLLNLGVDGKAFLNDRPLLPKDIAILVRTNNEAKEMQLALSACRVPSVVHNTESVFASREADEIELIAMAMAEPGNRGKIRAALATECLGIQGHEIFIPLQDDIPGENAEVLEAWQDIFFQLHEDWRINGFMASFRSLLDDHQIRFRLLSYPDGERRLTNILHLVEIMHNAGQDNHLGLSGLLDFLADQKTEPQGDKQESQLRLESDADCIQIVTIHKAKGLEYPVVFCPFSWDGTHLDSKNELFFHRPNSRNGGHELVLDIGSADIDQNRQKAMLEEIAENLRLLYVALTRAKSCCYLVWGRFNKADTSALAYLLHQPPEKQNQTRPHIAELLEAVAHRFCTADAAVLSADLERIAAASEGTIKLTPPPTAPPGTYSPRAADADKLASLDFSGMPPLRQITSFSGLIHGQYENVDHPDHDALAEKTHADMDSSTTETLQADRTLLIFPHGKGPGTFLHDLLEHLDFTTTEPRQYVQKKLEHSGFEQAWEDVLVTMITNVLQTPLPEFPGGKRSSQNLVLAGLRNERRLNELEFYFPLNPVSPKVLQAVFTGVGQQQTTPCNEFDLSLARLRFSPACGFMKGFIDLVFEHNGRYYLVDWKSNFLGTEKRNYHPQALASVMHRSFYTLQYHLYCVALHQYLRSRIPDYKYENHFGGVFYIFLRGLQPAWGSDYGIYSDLPEEKLVQAISTALIPN